MENNAREGVGRAVDMLEENGFIAIAWVSRTPHGIPWFGVQIMRANVDDVVRHIDWKFTHTDAKDFKIMRPSEAKNYRNSAAGAMLESAGVVLA